MNSTQITGYKVISDELVRFSMQEGPDILMRFKRHCPQLYFHKYVGYTAVNGRLCAKFDDVFSRSGTTCRIDSLTLVHSD